MKELLLKLFNYQCDTRTKKFRVQFVMSLILLLLLTPALNAENGSGTNESEKMQRSVSGTVSDGNTGEALPGVNIVEKGTGNGTISDVNGNYTIDLTGENPTLVFSFIGYVDQEVVVGDQTTINISLVENVEALDEVVIVGYGTVSRKNLTTAISKVDPNQIEKAASSNMSQLLMGRAAGVEATLSSPQPGGNVNISIRGGGTPVYVIDGIVMPSGAQNSTAGSTAYVPSAIDRSGLNGLNPDDIESIEILKDASASIYGVNAANGVILVTTKKGKKGGFNVNYSGSYSFVKNLDYVSPLNSQDYMTLVNQFAKEQVFFNYAFEPFDSIPAPEEGWDIPYSAEDIANAPNYDWLDEILKSGSITNHNLTIQGGDEKTTYYLSGNYYNQKGTVTNSSMERYAIRSNLSYQLTSFLKLSSIMSVNRNSYLNSAVGGSSGGRGSQASGSLAAALSYPSFIPVRDENGDYSLFPGTFIPNAVSLGDIDDNTLTEGTYLNFVSDIDIIKEMLTAKLSYGYNKDNSFRSLFIPSTIYYDQSYLSRGNITSDQRTYQTMEAMVNFRKNFGDILNVEAIVGMGRYLTASNGFNAATSGQHDAIANDDISEATTKLPSSYRRSAEKRSQFIRANFDLLDKYVVETTFRRDGTDKFFPGNKYAWFPSVSVAWKLSNEGFIKDVSWINLLKLRASYGTTGEDNLGSDLYGSYEPAGQIYFNDGSDALNVYKSTGIDYPDIFWPKTIMKNVAIDFFLLNNRLSGSFDIYRYDKTRMLDEATSPGLSMFIIYPINGAHQRRSGWDASLNSDNIMKSRFSWSTNLTLTKYKNVWVERFPNSDLDPYQKVTDPTNAQYYYETNGIVNIDKSNMPASQPEVGRYPGYPIIVDQNGDNVIDTADIVMNSQTPDIYFGLGNTFTYGKFDLTIFMYAQLGVYKYNYAFDWAKASNLAAENNNENTYALDIWSMENQNGRFPGIAYDLAKTSLPLGVGTDAKYQDASFLRCRNITLGYNLKGSDVGLDKVFKNLRIYIDVQNPFIITNFEGFDPEIRTGGSYKSQKAEYPQTRTYSAGVKINF